MLFKSGNKNKYGFTLIEVLLICSAFAILVSGVIMAINRAYEFMNNTRVRIRATNFAREGVEMMFNIRDTNRRKYSGDKDKYWLFLGNGDVNQIFQKGLYLKEGLYAIREGKENGDTYFYLDGASMQVVSDNGDADYFYTEEGFWDEQYKDQRLAAKIEFNGNYNYMEYSGGARTEKIGTIQNLLSNETSFYRLVRVYGIYKKNTETSDDKIEDLENYIGEPLEMRFCVKVFYQHQNSQNSSELCSIMTNFME